MIGLRNSHSAKLRAIWLAVVLLAIAAGSGVAQPAQPSAGAPTAQSAAVPQSAPNGGEQAAPDAQSTAKQEEIKDENEQYRQSATVQKLGHMLGMSTATAATAFEVFNFLVLALLVGFVLLKSLPKLFRKRTTDIQKRLVDARTATEEANARLNSVESRLEKLDAEIAALRTQATAAGERDERRMRDSIDDEKRKILSAADTEIQAATAMARRQIGQYAAELAVEQAARKLVVTAETDRLLVKSFAERLAGKSGGEN